MPSGRRTLWIRLLTHPGTFCASLVWERARGVCVCGGGVDCVVFIILLTTDRSLLINQKVFFSSKFVAIVS